jgi:hypothetical protein
MRIEKGIHYVRLGQFAIAWRDAWTKRWGLAIEWGERNVLVWRLP